MKCVEGRNEMLAPLKKAEKLGLIEWIHTFTFSVSGWAPGGTLASSNYS